MTEPETTSAKEEHVHHHYVTHRIPWFVHLIWISFWTLAIWYVLSYLVPALKSERFQTKAQSSATK